MSSPAQLERKLLLLFVSEHGRDSYEQDLLSVKQAVPRASAWVSLMRLGKVMEPKSFIADQLLDLAQKVSRSDWRVTIRYKWIRQREKVSQATVEVCGRNFLVTRFSLSIAAASQGPLRTMMLELTSILMWTKVPCTSNHDLE